MMRTCWEALEIVQGLDFIGLFDMVKISARQDPSERAPKLRALENARNLSWPARGYRVTPISGARAPASLKQQR